MIKTFIGAAAALAAAVPAAAQSSREAESPDRLQIKPILEVRARYEDVDQAGLDAQAPSVCAPEPRRGSAPSRFWPRPKERRRQ
jgi:hypothetical protein